MNKKSLTSAIEYFDSWLPLRYQRQEIPGFAIAIAYKGKIVFNKCYGYANIEKKEKLTTDHLFRIASHSKTFTATSIMQLQEQKKLRIDDYIIQYLTWLKNHKDKRWQKVTIRQLLSHSAGISREGTNADYWQLRGKFPNKDEVKNNILESDLILDNNIKLKYSNFGYSLLGLLIEEVSKESYNDYVINHIIKPLNLKNIGPEYNAKIKNKFVRGYSRKNLDNKRLPIANIDTNAMSAATGFYSNAEDLCKYFLAQKIGSKKLLDDESKKEMQRTQWHAISQNSQGHEDYGLGLEIEIDGDRRTIGHGGGFPGQTTKSTYDPKNDIAVIVLTNSMDSPTYWMRDGIFNVLDYFSKNTTKVKPKHNLSRLAGRYIDLWDILDIVVTGDKVVVAYPDSWGVLNNPAELIYVDETTLKIGEYNSFGSEGELVKFNIKNNRVESISYAGSTMWPEKVWYEKINNLKEINNL